MTPGSDIEDRFARAVKAAVEASSGATAPPASTTGAAAQGAGPKQPRRWAFVLLILVLAIAVSVVGVALLQVRRNYIEHRPVRPEPSPSVANEEPGSPSPMEPGMGASAAPAAQTTEPAATPASSSGAVASASPAAVSNTPGAPAAPTPAAAASSTASMGGASARPEVPGDTSATGAPFPSAAPSPAPTPPSLTEQPRAPGKTDALVGLRRRLSSSPAVTPPPRIARVPVGMPMPHSTASASLTIEGFAASPQATPTAEQHAAIGVSSSGPSADTAENQSSAADSTPARRLIMISSPDHSVYWALEPAGTILRSVEGKAWQPEKSGVQVDLLAGEAPTNTVCWVVGRKGTILLTTDGTHWDHIKSPLNVDIVRVTALSADVADIVGADGSRFSTFDRGSNWMPTD